MLIRLDVVGGIVGIVGIVIFFVARVVGAVFLSLLIGLVLGYGGLLLLSALVPLRGIAVVGLACLLVVLFFLRLLPFGF